MEVDTVGYDGSRFVEDFHAARVAPFKGWFVQGRNGAKYGRLADGRGRYVSIVASPGKRNRRTGLRLGWSRKADAARVADEMNAGRI